MSTDQPAAAVHPERRATEYLANERTFLAWVRTSIAVMSLGFVVAKFGVWLRELVMHATSQPPSANTETSLYAGIAMMAAGGILAILAARRYHVVNRAIECDNVTADRGLAARARHRGVEVVAPAAFLARCPVR